MEIKLSDHFTFKKLLRFTAPSVVMMIFTSIYSVVDGFFVSNFVGKTPFAAVNLIMPFLSIISTVGFMFGAGGSAVVAKKLGEGKDKEANQNFSLFVYASFTLGVIFALLGIIFIRPISVFLGAEGEILKNCMIYGRIILAALPFFITQMLFQSFFVTAEKPKLGLFVTVTSGVCNIILDAVLVVLLPTEFKIVGAACATAVSQMVGGCFALIYFSRKNNSILKLGKTNFDGKAILKACTNGSSEFMSNVAMSIVSMLYNFKLLEYAGQDGVAAYGVMMYVGFIFVAVYVGYTIGVAPVIGYHDGAQNHDELKGLLRKSLMLIGISSVIMTVSAIILASPLSKIYVGYDKELFELTRHGFTIFSLSYLFMGYAIFGSGFFTALNDGVTSAVISFLRALVFQVAAVLLLPLIFGIDGIWYSIVAAEVAAMALSAIFLMIKKNKYHY